MFEIALQQIAVGLAFVPEVGGETLLVDRAERVGAELTADRHAELRRVEVLVVDVGPKAAVGPLLGEGDVPTKGGRLAADCASSRHGYGPLIGRTEYRHAQKSGGITAQGAILPRSRREVEQLGGWVVGGWLMVDECG